jgi:predicted nucleotidyltransferase
MSEDKSVQLDAIRRKYHLKLLLLHGSQVSQKLHAESDIDIAVVKNNASSLDLLGLISDLAKIFSSDRIDLTDLTLADPLLRHAVVTKSELLAGSQQEYQTLQLKAFHQYQDYQPYLDQEAKFVKQGNKTYVTA